MCEAIQPRLVIEWLKLDVIKSLCSSKADETYEQTQWIPAKTRLGTCAQRKKLMLKHNDPDDGSAFPRNTVMLRSYKSGELKVKLFSYLFLQKFSA